MNRLRRWAAVLLLALLASSCTKAPQLRGRLAALEQLTDLAEEQGAKKCSPRQLALARAHIEFAQLALRSGKLADAQDHVERAQLNADAAALLSPAQHCTSAPKPQPAPGDQDGDGFVDEDDECPAQPEVFNGVDDLDGCPDVPDSDSDGLADDQDACPILAEDQDGYLDEDGCPEADNDLDRVPDETDQCPDEPEDPDGYEDGDGCPEPDNDRDEIPDLADQCPNTPGQAEKDPVGCPIKPALVVVTDCEVKITQQIHFATGKAIIRRESYPVLDAVVDVLEKNDAIKLQIQGHTDDVGSHASNMDLSERRAGAVRKYLVSRGIAVHRLKAQGFGEEQPLVPNDSKENRALNRRVQFMRTEGHKEGCSPGGQDASESASNGTEVGTAP